MSTERQFGGLASYLRCCLIALLLIRIGRRTIAILVICLLAIGAIFLFPFPVSLSAVNLWDAFSLTVHSTFSTSFSAIARDIAIVAYVAWRRLRAGGWREVSKYIESVKDTAVALTVTFVLVIGYHSLFTLPAWMVPPPYHRTANLPTPENPALRLQKAKQVGTGPRSPQVTAGNCEEANLDACDLKQLCGRARALIDGIEGIQQEWKNHVQEWTRNQEDEDNNPALSAVQRTTNRDSRQATARLTDRMLVGIYVRQYKQDAINYHRALLDKATKPGLRDDSINSLYEHPVVLIQVDEIARDLNRIISAECSQ